MSPQDPKAEQASPRFCDQCAASLVPLPGPHVARTCSDCQKTVHVAEPGEGGKGIKVQKGDTFTIPAGSIRISLDPRRSAGQLSRPGITWFMQKVLVGDMPRSADGLEALIEKWTQAADKITNGSDLLKGYDLEDEHDAQRAVEQISKDKYSVEFWAMAVGAFCQDVESKLDRADAREAAFSAVRLAAAWSMLVFVRDLEDHVWTGYRHNRLIYGIAQAGAQTPAEAEAIAALEPAFARLGEDVLHAWVKSGVDLGQRLGVSDVDERLLKALAEYHLSLFEQRRMEKQLDKENRARSGVMYAGWFSAGAVVTGAIVGVLKAVGVL